MGKKEIKYADKNVGLLGSIPTPPQARQPSEFSSTTLDSVTQSIIATQTNIGGRSLDLKQVVGSGYSLLTTDDLGYGNNFHNSMIGAGAWEIYPPKLDTVNNKTSDYEILNDITTPSFTNSWIKFNKEGFYKISISAQDFITEFTDGPRASINAYFKAANDTSLITAPPNYTSSAYPMSINFTTNTTFGIGCNLDMLVKVISSANFFIFGYHMSTSTPTFDIDAVFNKINIFKIAEIPNGDVSI